MIALLETFFIQFGYLAVYLVLVLCGFGIPIPEDVTLAAGGVISGLGYTDVHIMAAVGFLGVLTGDGLMFLLGKHYGRQLLKFKPVARLMPPKRYAQVQQKFDRYGNRVLFVARFLPGLRSPIFLTAGMSGKISFWRWLVMDGMAAMISVPIWVYIGDFGAENRDWLMKQVHRFQYSLYAVVALAAIYIFYRWWLHRRMMIARRNALLEKRRRRQTGEPRPQTESTQK